MSKEEGPAFEKMLLPEYQSNDIENCLALFPICPIRFSNLFGFDRSFLPIEMGYFLQKVPENNKQAFPLFSFLAMITLACVHIFRPLERMKYP